MTTTYAAMPTRACMSPTEEKLRNTLDSLHTQLTDSKSLEEETLLVQHICDCHEALAKFLLQHHPVNVADYVQEIRHDLGDFCLDWAIVSKRSQRRRQSANAQMLRMQLCPEFVQGDAIRLLGYQNNNNNSYNNKDENDDGEIPTTGIFQTQMSTTPGTTSMKPTDAAKELGYRLRRLLMEHAYTNDNCTTYLKPFVRTTTNRLFDASTFTSRRWDLPTSNEHTLFALDILVRLFLFGIAVERDQIEQALGSMAVELLVHETEILTTHPISPSLLVSEVQIYPLSLEDLPLCRPPKDNHTKDCFFVTDWPIESLRSTKHAIMSIGYDTLELLSLAGSETGSTSNITSSGRLLDMCCGCGVQGIWEVIASEGHRPYRELIMSDINPRACRFACANLTLNPIPIEAHVYESDLYQLLHEENQRFTRILSNPPFVAMPKRCRSSSRIVQQSQDAFYASAADHGTQLVKRILQDPPLEPNGTMLLVTELPNVEESCTLLKSFVSTTDSMSIRIAYVAKDVETVEEYSRNREAEVVSYNDDDQEENKTEWAEEQRKAGIRNRALVLVALQQGGTGTSLHRYDGDTTRNRKQVSRNAKTEKVMDDDEQDEFLTAAGIEFTRRHLLNFV